MKLVETRTVNISDNFVPGYKDGCWDDHFIQQTFVDDTEFALEYLRNIDADIFEDDINN